MEQAMAEQKKQQPRPQGLRGGTEGGDAARAMNVEGRDERTSGTVSPVGGVHNPPPSRYHPATDLAARPLEDARLAGGKTADELLGYLRGVEFPTKKDPIIRAARRNGAPEDVLGALERLPATEYADADSFLRDYPRLPTPDDLAFRATAEEPKGRPRRL
jgi:hypothetical protein